MTMRRACAGATPALLAALTTGAAKDRVGVQLPKLKLSQTHDLLADLEAMGLPAKGDYSGFGRSDLEVTQVPGGRPLVGRKRC